MRSSTHPDTAPVQPSDRIPPTVRGLPLVGVVPQLLYDAPGELARIAHQHHGKIPKLKLGPADSYLVSHPEHLQHILQDQWRNYSKGEGMWRPLRRLVGLGLATSDGDLWRRHRHILQPLFTQRHLASISALMEAIIDRSLAPLDKAAATGRPIDIVHEMAVITQNVILETIFGCGLGRGESEVLAGAVATAMREINLRMMLYFLPERFPLPGEARLRRALQDLDQALLDLFDDRRQQGEEEGRDLLSVLLRSSKESVADGLNDREIRDELVTMFVAGNETTAMTISWVFYLLHRHPAVEERVYGEIASVLGDRSPSHDDLGRLPYGRMVIQETLRLYPTAWLIPRQSLVSDVIGGYRIPEGAALMLAVYATHHDPNLWERPEVFDPERFTPERSASRHRYAYYPFGGGPRLCIGHIFSMMETQLILTRVLQRFRLRLAPGWSVKAQPHTTLQPKGGLPMLVERR